MPNENLNLTQIYNYEQITDWLGTSGQPTEAQFSAIAEAEFKAVMNLALPTSDNALVNEGSIVTGLGMAYFQIPVEMENPTLDNLKLFFGVMDALVGQKIWVHCVVNARVSAFVYHYLRYGKGIDEEAATTQLLSRWKPQMNETWQGFLRISKADVLGK